MCDVTDVPYPDVLHLLHAALSGFYTLYKIFGYFDISERMIGISHDYKVKVWCNSNFSIANPPKSSLVIHKNEKDMVHSILNIIDRNTDSLSKIEPFMKKIQHKSRSTFKEALKMLANYAKSLKMEIPAYMELTA
jgi:hypothetical protein